MRSRSHRGFWAGGLWAGLQFAETAEGRDESARRGLGGGRGAGPGRDGRAAGHGGAGPSLTTRPAGPELQQLRAALHQLCKREPPVPLQQDCLPGGAGESPPSRSVPSPLAAGLPWRQMGCAGNQHTRKPVLWRGRCGGAERREEPLGGPPHPWQGCSRPGEEQGPEEVVRVAPLGSELPGLGGVHAEVPWPGPWMASAWGTGWEGPGARRQRPAACRRSTSASRWTGRRSPSPTISPASASSR